MKGIEVSLLASSNDGTEVIKHCLTKGHRWGITPEEGWNALEYVHILKGKMVLKSTRGDRVVQTGDFLFSNPIEEYAMFTAEEDTEFIYVCSQPVFHYYSQSTKKLMDLAIEVEQKDGYTADHCERITKLSMKLGMEMKLPSYEMYLLNYASFFHDLGKTRVPDSILKKPSKLTQGEWEIMKLHTTYGKDILNESGIPVLKQVGEVIEQHHERFDGNGYPNRIHGEAVDIKASIISVVDSFDAMTSDRVYQKARSSEEAVEEIVKCSGSMYHPKVVDTFLSIILKEEVVS